MTKIKWVFVASLIIMMLVALPLMTACEAPVEEEEEEAPTITPMELRFGSVWAPPDVFYSSYEAKLWMDMITERTGGAITFNQSWGGTLGSPGEYFDLVTTGALDIGHATTLYAPSKFPLADYAYACVTGPVGEITVNANRQLWEEFPQFEQDFTTQNLVMIATTPVFEYTFASATPITTVEDFNGKKVMVIGPWPGKWLEPIGAVPVVAPGQDRYSMAQTGVADVDLLPMDHQWGYGVLEVLPYFIGGTDLAPAPTITIFMNLDTFNSLSPEVQEIFLDAGEDMELLSVTVEGPKWIEERIYADYQAAGYHMSTFPSEEMAKWQEMMPDIGADYAAALTEKGYPGWEIMQRYQEITSDMGYEWLRQWAVR